MMTAAKTRARGAIGVLQNKIQIKWDLAGRYFRKAMQTSSVPLRTQATHRAQAYVHQATALISRLPEDLRAAARAADPRTKQS